MTMEYRLVSADSHINEPPRLWLDRLPAKFAERAPHIERLEEGDAWIMEGALDPINFGGNCSAGIPLAQRQAWIEWDEVRPGGYQPAPRLEDQHADGVDAEVLYPTPRVSNQLFWNAGDHEFHVACIRAYNDWLSEFASYAPERLWGVAMIPNSSVGEAVAEATRALELPGIRGVMIGQYPHGGTEIAAEDDALWGLLAERRAPVSIHVSFATEPQGDKRRLKIRSDTRFYDAPVRIGQFITSGAFLRFPELRLVLAEVDSSWLPYLAEQMDDRYKRTVEGSRPEAILPSAYFARNIWSTFINDRYGIANRHWVGLDRMMWSSDFPHGGSDWPSSRAVLDEACGGVPEAERHALAAGNVVGLYGLADEAIIAAGS